ncbi:MAG TPA: polyprenol phosphomannose-dependent alpha 1,6 mannosyltransferase MptB, partial [Streptosporangiaceae bacterium]|nr:polyprenol phosphomannose-dependent alpha 1,6 mannosyltransferase MptB [Streptosporangiaceae bacterium]
MITEARAKAERAQGAPRSGLAALGVSVAATFTVAVAGASVMEPPLPGQAGQPPWAFRLNPSPYLAVGLTALALASGTLGLVLTLRAVRAGWRMPPRFLLLAGLTAAAALTLVPPFGSADHLSYAAYGRMVATGHNPYLTTPSQLAAHGDPVGAAVLDWQAAVSVYGPLASGIQALASLIGGTSVRMTVFVLGLVNLIAFGGAGALLYRMTSGRQDRQLRAVLMWTANPLLLQVLVAGAHVDTQAIALCVAAVAVLYGPWSPPGPALQPSLRRAALAGALLGCGFAIKVTSALIAVALAIALTHPRTAQTRGAYRLRAIAALAAGFAIVAGIAVAIGGRAMLRADSQASGMVSIGSPWRVIRLGLQHILGYGAATDTVKYGAAALAVLLALLITRRLPSALSHGCDNQPPIAAWLSQPSAEDGVRAGPEVRLGTGVRLGAGVPVGGGVPKVVGVL